MFTKVYAAEVSHKTSAQKFNLVMLETIRH